MAGQTYQPHIDGLRAVAVISVLLFHLGIAGTAGGFVGVDVFFVISGFLITRIIASGLANGTFQLREFYLRRAQRILPALFATILATITFGFLLLSPSDMIALGKSAIFATLSGSNLLFWTKSSYFDSIALYRPLLHTWSLSVEEQYYLLYPAAVILVTARFKRAGLPILLVAGGALSLLANPVFADGFTYLIGDHQPWHGWFSNGTATIYYLTPFRAFEFAIGGLGIYIPVNRISPTLRDLMFLVGAVLLGFAILQFNEIMTFPSYNALVPTLGSFLIIIGGGAKLGVMTLSRPTVTAIGRISYSLYLVHWPIIVFYRYYTQRPLTLIDGFYIVAVTLIIAVLLYHFIEQGFRYGVGSRQTSRKTAMFVLSSLGAAIILFSFSILHTSGWVWRLPAAAQEYAIRRMEITQADQGGIEGYFDCQLHCEFGDLSSRKIVLVVGDSHANHFTKALDLLNDGYRFRVFQSAQCFVGRDIRNDTPPEYEKTCEKVRRDLSRWLLDPALWGSYKSSNGIGMIR